MARVNERERVAAAQKKTHKISARFIGRTKKNIASHHKSRERWRCRAGLSMTKCRGWEREKLSEAGRRRVKLFCCCCCLAMKHKIIIKKLTPTHFIVLLLSSFSHHGRHHVQSADEEIGLFRPWPWSSLWKKWRWFRFDNEKTLIKIFFTSLLPSLSCWRK